MYIVTRRYEGVSSQFAGEGVRQLKEGMLPILRQIKGFTCYDVLDAGSGVIVTISTFENRSGAEESTRKAAEWVKQNMASIVPQAPQVTAGEVVVHERPLAASTR